MSVISDTVQWFATRANWSGEDGIPHRLLQHVEYTTTTLIVASLIAIPIGVIIGHTRRFRGPSVVLTGALRALPTLGVVTMASLYTGIDLRAALLALVLLAIPPLLAGAYSGIESVDPDVVDAARAVGMNEWQIAFRVELPLAMPVIVGGIRSATLQIIATATVAAYVPGPGGLGRFLLDGLALNDYARVVGGSLLVIALALVVDALFALIQRVALDPQTQTQTAAI